MDRDDMRLQKGKQCVSDSILDYQFLWGHFEEKKTFGRNRLKWNQVGLIC